MTAPQDGPLLLVDGASLWFRAFHAVPTSLTAPDGRPVNALRGFCDMIAALLGRYHPRRLVVCLDLDWRPKFRVDLLPSYKAHRVSEDNAHGDRPPPAHSSPREPDTAGTTGPATAPGLEEDVPDALTPQVAMILEVLATAGLATAGAAGLEADDVIGTLAHRERRNPVIAVSGDRDLFQLVRDDEPPVQVCYVGRGLARAELVGPAELAKKYGLPVENAGDAYAAMATLRGDPSDGLPGVAGIGEKTAATLISRYGTLAALQTAAADPTSGLASRWRTRLANAASYLAAATPVVQVVRDADVVLSGPDQVPHEPPDLQRLRTLAASYNAASPIERLITAFPDYRTADHRTA